jgi:hypothetical protein
MSQVALQELEEWARQQGIHFLKIKLAQFPAPYNNGAVILETINHGEDIVTVPLDLCISTATGTALPCDNILIFLLSRRSARASQSDEVTCGRFFFFSTAPHSHG